MSTLEEKAPASSNFASSWPQAPATMVSPDSEIATDAPKASPEQGWEG
jgi:hypothetical protein